MLTDLLRGVCWSLDRSTALTVTDSSVVLNPRGECASLKSLKPLSESIRLTFLIVKRAV